MYSQPGSESPQYGVARFLKNTGRKTSAAHKAAHKRPRHKKAQYTRAALPTSKSTRLGGTSREEMRASRKSGYCRFSVRHIAQTLIAIPRISIARGRWCTPENRLGS